MLTTSELKQVKHYLELYSKKDSQLPAVPVNLEHPEGVFTAEDYLAIVQDADNKIITIKNLEKVFLLTFLTDEDFREALKGKIPEEMLENACVTTEKLADGAVTTIKLGNSAVTTAKIANGAITNEKIANDTIQGAAFAANSITTDKIVDGTVTGDKLADGSIQSVDIKDNTLSGSKFVDGSISGSKIQDNVIESKHLLDNSIPASKIKDGSIESIDIKDGTLDGSKIAENTVQGSKFANNAITSTKIIDNSISTSKIADNAITTAKIVDNSITTNKITNDSVTTAKIADESVTENKLADGAVTTAKLADGLISEIQNITDATPTTGSVKPVQSGGVKIAIDNVAFSTSEKVKNIGIDNEPTAGSNNITESDGVAKAISKVGYLKASILDRTGVEFNANPGDVLNFKFKGYQSAIVFYNNNTLLYEYVADTSETTGSWTATDYVTKVCCKYADNINDVEVTIKRYNYKGNLDTLLTHVNEIDTNLSSELSKTNDSLPIYIKSSNYKALGKVATSSGVGQDISISTSSYNTNSYLQVRVKKDEKFLVTTTGKIGEAPSYIFTGADNKALVISSSAILNNNLVTAPADGFLYVNFGNQTLYSVVSKYIDNSTTEGRLSTIESDISRIKSDYLAQGIGPGTIPLSSDMFEVGNISGSTGGNIDAPNAKRLIGYLNVEPSSTIEITKSSQDAYRVNILYYDKNKVYLGNTDWKVPPTQKSFNNDVRYIRLVIAPPSGSSTPVDFDSVGMTLESNKAVINVRAEAYKEPIKTYHKPIYAPSSQKAANGGDDSDFDAETLTSTQLYQAFTELIAELPIVNAYIVGNPKLISKDSNVGRDQSNQLDINCYAIGNRNRYAYKHSSQLFGWVNGSTVVYTDSCSPRVGDSVYTDTERTLSEYTVSSYNSDDIIVLSNSTSYTYSENDYVPSDIIYTFQLPRTDFPSDIQFTAFNKNNSVIGTATYSFSTNEMTFNSKSYTRDDFYDYHTGQVATIFLYGNEHGPQSDPIEPAIILYRLAKDLIEGAANNDYISWIKNYCKVVVVPCLNPWGLDHHTRENSSGVNINRNYPGDRWSSQTDQDKGAYGGDQNETQYIINKIKDVNPDVCIDIHCLGYVSQTVNEGRVHYSDVAGLDVNELANVMSSMGYNLSEYPVDNNNGAYWIYANSINGGLIEMNSGPYASSYNGKQHGSDVLLVDYTFLLNSILAWYKRLDESFNLNGFIY